MYTAFKNSDGICISPNLYDSSTNLDQTFAFVKNTSHCDGLFRTSSYTASSQK